jgi:chromosome segregation ATPase
LIQTLIPIVTLAGFLLVTRRNWKQDDTSNGREMGALLTEIGYIKSSIDGLSKKFDVLESRHTEFAERLAKVEASAQSAHKRLDSFEGREARE